MTLIDRIEKELEWYLRDFFFRINNSKDIDKNGELKESKNLSQNEKNGFIDKFQIYEVLNYLANNYLRYKNSDINELSNNLNKVINKMSKQGIISIEESKVIILYSPFDRKQCVSCYYINYTSEKDNLICQRCGSDNLQVFPRKVSGPK